MRGALLWAHACVLLSCLTVTSRCPSAAHGRVRSRAVQLQLQREKPLLGRENRVVVQLPLQAKVIHREE